MLQLAAFIQASGLDVLEIMDQTITLAVHNLLKPIEG